MPLKDEIIAQAEACALDDRQFELRPLPNPARPLSGLLLRSLSIRRSAAATRSRARSRSATVYCRGSGRVRFLARSLRRPPGADGRLELLPRSQ